MSAAGRQGGLALLVLGATHLLIDSYSSGYAPLLAPLRDSLGLTLAQVGGCTATLTFSSSLMQPLYGLLSDRLRTRLIVALAPAATAIGLASLSFSSGYLAALACFFVAGVGIAAFHPQGAAQATELSSRRPGLAMSLFIGSGNLGFALGPGLMGLAIAAWGWEGLWRIAIPGVLGTLVLLRIAPTPEPRVKPEETDGVAESLRRHWRPLSRLYLLTVVRGAVQLTYVGFLPLYLIRIGYSLSGASWALGAFLAAGSVGGLIGGGLADRLGSRSVIRISMAGSLPFFLAAFALPPGGRLPVLCVGYSILLLDHACLSLDGSELGPRTPQHRIVVDDGLRLGSGGRRRSPGRQARRPVRPRHSALHGRDAAGPGDLARLEPAGASGPGSCPGCRSSEHGVVARGLRTALLY